MTEQETPKAIAADLARYLPSSAREVLDPCTGNGALIVPILKRLPHARITAIDIRATALRDAKSRLSLDFSRRRAFLRADFLKWGYRNRHKQVFDCIVMNPPFHARRGDYVELLPSRRKVPIEIAFVITALELLRHRGRLLAVLPYSPVASATASWFRTLLLNCGSIKYVHELPPFAFPSVESRIYLTVFEKGSTDNRMGLLNHDLKQPHRLTLNRKGLAETKRLDFGWYEGRSQLLKYQKVKQFKWQPLGQVVQIIRGDCKSPAGKTQALHTTHFEGLFWRRIVDNPNSTHDSRASIQWGDLLLRRVSRGALSSCGPHIACEGQRCSDCVLILRPLKVQTSLRLLFALRIFFRIRAARQTIESGTGSTYLSAKELAELKIPANLANCFPNEFKAYSSAIRRRSNGAACSIEEAVNLKLSQQLAAR